MPLTSQCPGAAQTAPRPGTPLPQIEPLETLVLVLIAAHVLVELVVRLCS